jgi:hypothetical protein
MFRKFIAVTALGLAVPLGLPAAAQANAQICAEPSTLYSFSSVAVSSRPTNVKSAYVTGPAVISYNKTVSATVGLTASSSVTAEAGVVVAKASTQLGLALTTSRTWTDGFTYALTVPSGQRRAMQLFQESRSFYVTKKSLVYPCSYKIVYSGQSANAPRTAREDEWKLVA